MGVPAITPEPRQSWNCAKTVAEVSSLDPWAVLVAARTTYRVPSLSTMASCVGTFGNAL